jgi:outer membrane protein
MKLNKCFLLIWALLSIGTATAQTTLRLEEAVAIALQNNYSILMVEKQVSIAENNVSWGEAGMLPRISADVSTAAGLQNTTQTLLSGETRALRGAGSRNSAYGINLQWTLFDGLQMFVRYEQLKQIQALGEAQYRAEVLSTVASVMQVYYQIVQQRQLILATQHAIELSGFRLATATNRYEIGRASRLEVLTAQVDLNTDTTLLLRQQDAMKRLKVQLNQWLSRDVQTPFEVEESYQIDPNLPFEEIVQQAQQLNPEVQAALLRQRIQELEVSRIRGGRYPVVSMNSAYTRSQSQTELGFSTRSRNQGLNIGLAASVPLLNGGAQRRSERMAQLELERSAIDVQQIRLDLDAQVLNAYQTYVTQLELLRLEENNAQIAKQNLDITLEKFKIGSIAPLEFREAQRNFIDATTRLSEAKNQAKLAEIALKQLAASLPLPTL